MHKAIEVLIIEQAINKGVTTGRAIQQVVNKGVTTNTAIEQEISKPRQCTIIL
jgi:hypothetical protein